MSYSDFGPPQPRQEETVTTGSQQYVGPLFNSAGDIVGKTTDPKPDDYSKDADVDLTTFQQLLSKLEGSKKRQQRQKSVEGRRDIYAQGLASMMRNF